ALEQGLVELATTRMDSPIGGLLVAATSRGVVRVAFEVEGFDAVLEQMAAAVSPRMLELRTPLLERAVQELETYFSEAGHQLDVPLDLQLARGAYRREVLDLLARIPAGATRTYREIAV